MRLELASSSVCTILLIQRYAHAVQSAKACVCADVTGLSSTDLIALCEVWKQRQSGGGT